MDTFKKMEVFICSEDHTRSIGLVDEAEVWSNDSELGHLILRGFNSSRDDLLQAENECLRQDVEFYKNRSTVERELEMPEDEFGALVLGPEDLTMSEVAERLKISLVKPGPEPANAEKLARELLESFNRCEFDLEDTFEQMAQALAARGVKVPDA